MTGLIFISSFIGVTLFHAPFYPNNTRACSQEAKQRGSIFHDDFVIGFSLYVTSCVAASEITIAPVY